MDALDRFLTHLEDGLLTLLLLTLLTLAMLSMVLRWMGNGLSFLDPILRYGVFWLGLLGGVAAIRQGHHVQIGLLSPLIPKGLNRYLQQALALLSAILCVALAHAGYNFVIAERAAATTAFGGIPLWILQLFLPLGFSLMSLRFTLRAFGQGLHPEPVE